MISNYDNHGWQKCRFMEETMLVLSRKPGERVRIADNIGITVLEISGGRIKLGISAPPEVPVLRDELVLREEQFAPALEYAEFA